MAESSRPHFGQSPEYHSTKCRIRSFSRLTKIASRCFWMFRASSRDKMTILLYTKANEDVSKFLSTIKSKEQCEQLRALLALDIRYLNGCDYQLGKQDGIAVPSPANVPALGLITSYQEMTKRRLRHHPATPPPRGRERRVEADGTPSDSDLESSKGIGRSSGRNRGGRSGGGG